MPTETAADEATNSVGAFLHATLRPILKLQNPLLLAVVADFVADHHIPLAGADATHRERLLTELLTRNVKLRYTIIGLISGQFTADEYTFYRQHRAELNRRLLDLTLQRILTQAETIMPSRSAAGAGH